MYINEVTEGNFEKKKKKKVTFGHFYVRSLFFPKNVNFHIENMLKTLLHKLFPQNASVASLGKLHQFCHKRRKNM